MLRTLARFGEVMTSHDDHASTIETAEDAPAGLSPSVDVVEHDNPEGETIHASKEEDPSKPLLQLDTSLSGTSSAHSAQGSDATSATSTPSVEVSEPQTPRALETSPLGPMPPPSPARSQRSSADAAMAPREPRSPHRRSTIDVSVHAVCSERCGYTDTSL